MNFSSREFRNAMGTFATGVTVITTVDEEGEPVGLTANSFSSVSLDPPLVLFCLDKGSLSLPIFQAAEHFSITVLADTQEELSTNFASQSPDKWDGVDYKICTNGCPYFEHALAVLECDTDAIHDAGDHVIIVGRVTAFSVDADRSPLLYYRGRYARIGAG